MILRNLFTAIIAKKILETSIFVEINCKKIIRLNMTAKGFIS
jgi:hypothetical protein